MVSWNATWWPWLSCHAIEKKDEGCLQWLTIGKKRIETAWHFCSDNMHLKNKKGMVSNWMMTKITTDSPGEHLHPGFCSWFIFEWEALLHRSVLHDNKEFQLLMCLAICTDAECKLWKHFCWPEAAQQGEHFDAKWTKIVTGILHVKCWDVTGPSKCCPPGHGTCSFMETQWCGSWPLCLMWMRSMLIAAASTACCLDGVDHGLSASCGCVPCSIEEVSAACCSASLETLRSVTLPSPICTVSCPGVVCWWQVRLSCVHWRWRSQCQQWCWCARFCVPNVCQSEGTLQFYRGEAPCNRLYVTGHKNKMKVMCKNNPLHDDENHMNAALRPSIEHNAAHTSTNNSYIHCCMCFVEKTVTINPKYDEKSIIFMLHGGSSVFDGKWAHESVDSSNSSGQASRWSSGNYWSLLVEVQAHRCSVWLLTMRKIRAEGREKGSAACLFFSVNVASIMTGDGVKTAGTSVYERLMYSLHWQKAVFIVCEDDPSAMVTRDHRVVLKRG